MPRTISEQLGLSRYIAAVKEKDVPHYSGVAEFVALPRILLAGSRFNRLELAQVTTWLWQYVEQETKLLFNANLDQHISSWLDSLLPLPLDKMLEFYANVDHDDFMLKNAEILQQISAFISTYPSLCRNLENNVFPFGAKLLLRVAALTAAIQMLSNLSVAFYDKPCKAQNPTPPTV
jgi:hypothetical protein